MSNDVFSDCFGIEICTDNSTAMQLTHLFDIRLRLLCELHKYCADVNVKAWDRKRRHNRNICSHTHTRTTKRHCRTVFTISLYSYTQPYRYTATHMIIVNCYSNVSIYVCTIYSNDISPQASLTQSHTIEPKRKKKLGAFWERKRFNC